MDALRQDFRYAVRALRRTPAVTALVVASLGLAIAGNTAVFSLLDALLFAPLPFAEPERLAFVGEYQDPSMAGQISGLSPATFLDLAARQRSFEALAAYRPEPVRLGESAAADRGEPLTSALVSPEFFPVLGVDAALGRTLMAEEGRPGAAASVVVLDHAFWRTRFASDPGILGRKLTLNGAAFTVVGVLPERFEFLDPGVVLYRPLALDPASASRDRRNLLAIGRLATGVDTEAADAEVAALGKRLAEEHPEAYRGYQTQVLNLRHELPSPQDRQLLALVQGALVFVLLIACANVANLFLARAQSRTTELAVRSSLGAGRWRIARQIATESVVAATAGGVLGLGLGALATRLIADSMAARLPRFWLPRVDAGELLFTAAIAVGAGLLVGLLPALQAARMNVQAALKEGGRGGSLGGRRRLASRALVVAEIALSLVLLGGGAVLVRSFVELQEKDVGFETAGLVTLRVEVGQAPPAERAVVAEDLVARLAAIPGVAGATASSDRPRTPFLSAEPYTVDGAPPLEGQAAPGAGVLVADRWFFETLGVPVVAGRGFASTDGLRAAPVALVNRSFARRHWPEGDPVGRTVEIRGESRRIAGVVEDLRHSIFTDAAAEPAVYLPLAQAPPESVAITLRVGASAAGWGEAVRATLAGYDPALVVSQVLPLEEFTAQFFAGMRVITTILGAFGALALLLAALGTYGVLAYTVAQRTHEIGVRMALGARASEVRGMVTRQGLLLAGLGIVLGVPGVVLVTRLVGSAVSGLAAVEPLTVLVVAAVLAVVTVLASWMPARRAAAVDPAIALRGE